MTTIEIPNLGRLPVEEHDSSEPRLRLIATEERIALYGFVDRDYSVPSTFVITRQTGADQVFERLEHDLTSAVAEFDKLLGPS